MPRSRPPYPPEFRAEAVRLVKSSGEAIPRIAQGPRDLRPDPSQLGRPGRPRRRRTPGPDLRRGGPACASSKRRTEAPRGARDPEKSRGGCCVTPPDPSGSPGTLGVMSGQRFISGSRDQAFWLPPDMRRGSRRRWRRARSPARVASPTSSHAVSGRGVPAARAAHDSRSEERADGRAHVEHARDLTRILHQDERPGRSRGAATSG